MLKVYLTLFALVTIIMKDLYPLP